MTMRAALRKVSTSTVVAAAAATLAAVVAVAPGPVAAQTPEPSGLAAEAGGDANDLVSSDGSIAAVPNREAVPTDAGRSFEGNPSAITADNGPLPAIADGVSSPGRAARAPSESVIDPDGRTQVAPTTTYPSTAIGQVTFRQFNGNFVANYICSGYLIAATPVATSGHCVNWGGEGTDPAYWSTDVTFTAGRDGGSSSTFPTCNATSLLTTKDWLDSFDEYADLGFIQLGCNAGNTVGWFGYFAATDSALMSVPLTVRGYPGDKPTGTMWTMDDSVRVLESDMVYYQADTAGGQSGSPVYTDQGEGCSACAIATHGYGLHGGSPHSTNNHGPRITDARRVQFYGAAQANSCAGHDFIDVPPWVDKAVDWAACQSFLEGYGDLFKPYDSITRAEMARLLYRIAGTPPLTGLPAHAFTDVPEWVDAAVTWLAGNGFITGYDDDTFRPDEAITRAAVARMLFRIAEAPPGSPPHGFTDVPAWVEAAVRWIANPNNDPEYASGFAGNLFKPLDDINRAQTTRMACRVNAVIDCG